MLVEAVKAFRAALEVCTRDTLPTDWAMVQNNLGIALRVQSEHSNGAVAIELLSEAVTAYRAALEVYTQTSLPVQWATTQNNLGYALCAQGALGSDETGIALLAESVAAYRAALKVRTREQMPVQWAMTQENIAVAFRNLAEADRPNRCAHYRASRNSVLSSLKVYTLEHMPRDHGTATQLLIDVEAAIAEHCPATP